jgi:hypothetical protein
VDADIPGRLGYDLPGTYFMAHKLAGTLTTAFLLLAAAATAKILRLWGCD